ncbi:competence/damage-inducible protein A [Kiritimatiella glycovorans]|uniref:NMN amidohydrolase-like protein YfaY n=1 Tax=Kiritimatiella glycovorans TaxID=1307763 RepID=A0A0G3EDC8_9BACT|nr:molybdopterin-binding protein [Kiritimatiella glycovorans]AKJ63372.1 NMN amidohydrolase-like protein YfaY [Kiritimatiella glycovorans]
MTVPAELVSIGSELLSGRTVNTHAQTLGAALLPLGLRLERDTTIPDGTAVIAETVGDALARVPLVFVSGGLGPTADDVTCEALASLLGRDILEDPGALESMRRKYAQRGRAMNTVSRRQARVLRGAAAVENPRGMAPGQRIELEGERILFVLPGPSREFAAMLDQSILPFLSERYAGKSPRPVRIIHTEGLGESEIVERLERENLPPPEIQTAFYAGNGRVEILLSCGPGDESLLEATACRFRTLLS